MYHLYRSLMESRVIVLFWIIVLAVIIILLAIIAHFMAESAKLKGYGPEYHIFAKCFFLFLPGILYTISLPDLKTRQKIEDLAKALSASDKKPDSVADEIMKAKQLFEAGVITQAEFESKKSLLLSMYNGNNRL